jgi:hypothetical protein
MERGDDGKNGKTMRKGGEEEEKEGEEREGRKR